MRRLVRRSLGVLSTSLLIAVGCGDDDDSDTTNTGGAATSGGAHAGGTTSGAGTHSGGTGGLSGGGVGGASESSECQVVGELCHEADTGVGPAHDCHELGHSGDTAACHESFASCIAVCVEDEGGEGTGGASGGGQSPYCLALGELCHPVASVSAALEECHEIGHIGDAPVCAMQFEECAKACLAAREEAEGGGSGSAGGMSAGGASAGGGGSGG